MGDPSCSTTSLRAWRFASIGARTVPAFRITDLRTSKKIFLDPLELLSLSWSMHRDLVTHLDPSRWWSEFAEDMELRLALASPVSADGQNGQYGTDGRGG